MSCRLVRRPSLPLHAALDQQDALAAASAAASLSGPLLDEADTDLALEEEREERSRLRRAAEEAAGDDTGYVMMPPMPRAPTKAGGGGSVLSLAALEARAHLEREKREKKEREQAAGQEELALPILGRKAEIAGTIAAHRVTIIEGESE